MDTCGSQHPPTDRQRRPVARLGRGIAVACAAALVASGCSTGDEPESATASDGGGAPIPAEATLTCEASVGDDEALAEQLVDIAGSAMADQDLRSVTISVSRGGEEIVTTSLGDSVDGVPAEPSMRFYNGAVLFTYLGTAMLQLHEEGVLDVDEPIERWVSGVPGGDTITPRMLMTSSSGLADFETTQAWIDALYADPFRPFTDEELESYVFDQPLLFEPGTNVSYSHLGFRIAGAVVESATGQPLDTVLAERIVEPLGMEATESVDTAEVDGPVLRTYTDERGVYEESTSWSPAWGVPANGIQVTNICDLRRSAFGIGSGELLDAEGYESFLADDSAGLGQRTDSCPSCIPTDEEIHLGFGTTVAGDWLIQTPLFTGIAAVQAYLPAEANDGEEVAIAVSNTFAPGADVGENASTSIMARVAEVLAPTNPLPPQIA